MKTPYIVYILDVVWNKFQNTQLGFIWFVAMSKSFNSKLSLLFLTEQSRTIKNDAWKELSVLDLSVFSMQWYKIFYWTCFFGDWMQPVWQKDQTLKIRSISVLAFWDICSIHFFSFESVYISLLYYIYTYHLAVFFNAKIQVRYWKSHFSVHADTEQGYPDFEMNSWWLLIYKNKFNQCS